MRERITPLLKLALAGALVGWLLRSGQLRLGELAQVGDRWHWILLAQLPFALLMLLLAARWQLLLRAQGVPAQPRDTGALVLIGWFFNQMALGTTGGDVVKAYAIAVEHPERRGAAITSIFMDRLVGMCALLALVLVAALPNQALVRSAPGLALYLGTVASVSAALALGAGAYLSPRVRSLGIARLLARLPFQGPLQAVDRALDTCRRQPRALALAFAASLGIHCLTIAVNLLLARALLDGPLDWRALLLLIPMAHLAMGLPINPPGAIGTAEALYQVLLALAGIAQGSLICVLQRLVWYAWALVGGLIYVSRRSGRRTAAESPAQPPA